MSIQPRKKLTRLYMVRASITVEAMVIVSADSPEEAEARLKEGAWHGVQDADWGKSTLLTQISKPADITVYGHDSRD